MISHVLFSKSIKTCDVTSELMVNPITVDKAMQIMDSRGWFLEVKLNMDCSEKMHKSNTI